MKRCSPLKPLLSRNINSERYYERVRVAETMDVCGVFLTHFFIWKMSRSVVTVRGNVGGIGGGIDRGVGGVCDGISVDSLSAVTIVVAMLVVMEA